MEVAQKKKVRMSMFCSSKLDGMTYAILAEVLTSESGPPDRAKTAVMIQAK